MELEPVEGESLYRTLAGAVVPRPIAWVSSASDAGVDNLAPFSFFNVVCVDPPLVAFSASDREDGLKDTPANVREREEFVVNVVTEGLAEAMNATSGTYDEDESEFDAAGVERADSTVVSPPRVADAKVAFECRLYDFLDLGTSSLVIGEVVYVHVADEVTTDGKVDTRKLDAVGRLAGNLYCRTDDRFRMERPP